MTINDPELRNILDEANKFLAVIQANKTGSHSNGTALTLVASIGKFKIAIKIIRPHIKNEIV